MKISKMVSLISQVENRSTVLKLKGVDHIVLQDSLILLKDKRIIDYEGNDLVSEPEHFEDQFNTMV